MSARAGTKNKILEMSEKLFVEQGYSNTSLRQITTKANVNLASVNYHFGDKKTLVRAILDQYLAKLMPELHHHLESLNQKDSFTVEEVLCAVKRPLVSLNELRPNGMGRFLLLVANGYSDIQGHLRWFIVNHYGQTLNLFTQSILKANPAINSEQLFWKLHFSLGAFVFASASSKALSELASSSLNIEAQPINIVDQAISYISAGFENSTTKQ
ncbi:TetR/AcrR family transcriptional regulator [Vibrio parahaemolyticus]|uniref:TetR/AcrR family transcriptional regulator n=1 Tax=Vibrio mediterranei TaxID=689 RepID=UPI004068E863